MAGNVPPDRIYVIIVAAHGKSQQMDLQVVSFLVADSEGRMRSGTLIYVRRGIIVWTVSRGSSAGRRVKGQLY